MMRVIRAAISSWNGIRAAFRSEAAIREEIIVLLVSVPLAFAMTSDGGRRAVLVGAVLLVLVVELLNTAIEKLADVVLDEPDERIGRIKDMGSAAVAAAILLAVAIWAAALYRLWQG